MEQSFTLLVFIISVHVHPIVTVIAIDIQHTNKLVTIIAIDIRHTDILVTVISIDIQHTDKLVTIIATDIQHTDKLVTNLLPLIFGTLTRCVTNVCVYSLSFPVIRLNLGAFCLIFVFLFARALQPQTKIVTSPSAAGFQIVSMLKVHQGSTVKELSVAFGRLIAGMELIPPREGRGLDWRSDRYV